MPVESAVALPHTHTGNGGDALIWGEALGAATADLTGYLTAKLDAQRKQFIATLIETLTAR